MTKVTPGLYHIANPLLQLLGAGKAAIAFSFPDQCVIDPDFEIATGAGKKCDLAQCLAEGAQKLLCHPSGPQEPIALGTIEDCNAGLFIHQFDLELRNADYVAQHIGCVNCLLPLPKQSKCFMRQQGNTVKADHDEV